jgi:hypothetical protein
MIFLESLVQNSSYPLGVVHALEANQDLPVYQVVPSMRAPVLHAARYRVISPLFTVTLLLPSGIMTPSAPGVSNFRR